MPWISGNRYLTLSEIYNNAAIIADIFRSSGWSRNAVSAMLGNMQAESGCNPGIWEGLTPYQGGYGLTQWTPYTKYSAWYGPGWQDNGPGECDRIMYEAANNIQWFRNDELGIDPPITFADFTTSTLPVNTLSNYWLWFYEHPANPGPTEQAIRQAYSQYMYNNIVAGTTLPPWLIIKMRNDVLRRCKL